MTDPKSKLLGLIKRQTNYSEEIILQKLIEHDDNIESIILEYNGVPSDGTTNTSKSISTNQKIFKAIRENMNGAKMNKDSKKQ